MDSADPTSAWSMKSFLEFDIGPAKNDVYGKLYHYLKHLFANFHRRLRSSPVAFTLLHVDAQRLPMSLTEKGFDRIDVGVLFLTNVDKKLILSSRWEILATKVTSVST